MRVDVIRCLSIGSRWKSKRAEAAMAASASAARNTSRAADPTAATAAMAAALIVVAAAGRRQPVGARAIASIGRPTAADRALARSCHGANGRGPRDPGSAWHDARSTPSTASCSRISPQPGDQVIAARGGKGGKGNTRIQVGHQSGSARIHARGEDAERRLITLELKVIADVGLVGKPNAGKSTLLEPSVAGPAGNRRLSVHDQDTPTWASCSSTSTVRSSWPTFPG